jgi:hypothetical protein
VRQSHNEHHGTSAEAALLHRASAQHWLGRASRGRRAQARFTAAARAPREAGPGARSCSRARHPAGSARGALVAQSSVPARLPVEPEEGLRARGVPGRPLLGAARSRPSAGRGGRKGAMGRGMKSVAPRFAKAVNRVFGRSGKVLHGRYHIRLLRTPREVRNALAYVLLNARKHWKQAHGHAPPMRLDAASSGRWFDGWRGRLPARAPLVAREVAPPSTWLLCVGWRRHGLVSLGEGPGSAG